MAFFQFIDPINIMTGLKGAIESSSISITNDINFQQKLRLSVIDLVLGEYRISWSYSWNLDSTSHDFEARVQVNDVDTVGLHIEEPTDSLGNYGNTRSGQVLNFTGLATKILSGAVDIDLDWKAPQKNVPASIWNARLELWRIS